MPIFPTLEALVKHIAATIIPGASEILTVSRVTQGLLAQSKSVTGLFNQQALRTALRNEGVKISSDAFSRVWQQANETQSLYSAQQEYTPSSKILIKDMIRTKNEITGRFQFFYEVDVIGAGGIETTEFRSVILSETRTVEQAEALAMEDFNKEGRYREQQIAAARFLYAEKRL
tara:strand:+ start:143 stop:664 length:522 start_codon:yes stop_codon:yes gene_type:complete